MNLINFLEHKPLYYSKIDYTRMPRAYASIKEHMTIPKVIHVIGTNGKGTTGRFLANALFSLGLEVGHYTSPHIQDFNERIWLNGKNADNKILEESHQKLQRLLDEQFKESLSYFEYTTLLAMLVFEGCDYVVLEAGLGGEHDATNVFDKVLSVITPIGMDHEDFLGRTLKEIAGTKLRSVTNRAVVGEQRYAEVMEVAEELTTNERTFIPYRQNLDDTIIAMAEEISQEFKLPQYLKDNLLLSMSALKELGFEIKKNLFESQRLEGRMQQIKSNIWLDVGHNALAAEAISGCFLEKSVILLYNSYKDKDYLSILALLRPIVKRVEIIPVDDERIVSEEKLIAAIVENGLEYKPFEGIEDDHDYLVFGSFSVAEAFRRLC